jgi:hypothetical protein
MKCEEAAEFVSALCDGERIPREMAEHIGTCETCRARLNAYSVMGAELRRVASLEEQGEAKVGSWEGKQRIRLNWWQRGTQTMRIPLFAFALMLVVITVLSAGLLIVHARAGGRAYLDLKVKVPHGFSQESPITMSYGMPATPGPALGLSVGLPEGVLECTFRSIELQRDSVRLGIRAAWFAGMTNAELASKQIRSMPEREYEFVPGEPLLLAVEGLGQIELSGQLTDEPGTSKILLYPKDGELRVFGPAVFLRGDKLVAKLDGNTSITGDDAYFAMYLPTEGWYVFATRPFDAAVEGDLRSNQVQFRLEDQAYLLLTGAPIASGLRKIWVAHYSGNNAPTSLPTPTNEHEPFFTTGSLKNLTEGLHN